MTLLPTALEEAARAALLVRARLPGCQDEWHVLSTDPDFDDLPANGDEGCDDDEITQEAVLRVCAAAITAYLAQAEKEGWVMVPADRISAIWKEAEDCVPTNWCDGLLTGPKASRVPLDCPAVERLLLVIIKRIRDKAAAAQNGG